MYFIEEVFGYVVYMSMIIEHLCQNVNGIRIAICLVWLGYLRKYAGSIGRYGPTRLKTSFIGGAFASWL
jgi:hypothetical protein